MELVNKKYVKINKFNIFTQIVVSGANKEKVDFFQNLLNVVMNYERDSKHREFINEFYVSVDYINIYDTQITREIIMNALVYASLTSDFHMVKEITPYLYAKSYNYSDGNDTLDYILEHGISPDEYIDGEKERLIFNSDTNTFESGYIYNHDVKLERRKK